MKLKLDDIEKRNVYNVPDGYFDRLPMRVQKRIEAEKVPSKSWSRLPSWSLAMAASIALIVSLVFVFKGNNASAEDLLAEIPDYELIAYLDELDLDAYDLANAFPETTGSLDFGDAEELDQIDFGNESIDEILLEYNLYNEELEI